MSDEYLVRAHGKIEWHIAKPGCTTGMTEERCPDCHGLGTIEYKDPTDITGVLKKRKCTRCNEQGRVLRSDPDTLKLCWYGRSDELICYAGEEDSIARLPD